MSSFYVLGNIKEILFSTIKYNYAKQRREIPTWNGSSLWRSQMNGEILHSSGGCRGKPIANICIKKRKCSNQNQPVQKHACKIIQSIFRIITHTNPHAMVAQQKYPLTKCRYNQNQTRGKHGNRRLE